MYVDIDNFYKPFMSKAADFLLEEDKQGISLAEMSFLFNETVSDLEKKEKAEAEERKAVKKPEEKKEDSAEKPADDDIAAINKAIEDASDKPKKRTKKRKAPKTVGDVDKYADNVAERAAWSEEHAGDNFTNPMDINAFAHSVIGMEDD